MTKEIITYRMVYSGVWGKLRKSSSGSKLLKESDQPLTIAEIQALANKAIDELKPKPIQSFVWNVAERKERLVTHPDGITMLETPMIGKIVLRGQIQRKDMIQ